MNIKSIIAVGIAILLVTSLCLSVERNVIDSNSKVVVEGALLKTHGGVTLINGKVFSGKAYLLSLDGDTMAVDFYLGGKLNGISKAWFANGQVSRERLYVNGKKEGVHRGWWPNGDLKFRYEFEDDEYNGKVQEWYENGVVFREFSYRAGHENGPQKMWRLDGSVYANYFVKNNRIYGLSGRKNCKSIGKV